MKKSLIVVLAVVALSAWVWRQYGADIGRSTKPVSSTAQQSPTDLPVNSVLQVRPARSSDTGTPMSSSPLIKESAAMAQFRERRDLAALYQSVERDGAPEARYLRAEIYALCARQDDKGDQARAEDQAAFRAKFVAGLARSTTNTSRRIEALDQLNRDVCQGLALGKLDPKELARLIAAAADAGDLRAQAWQLADRLERSRVEPKGAHGGYNVTESDFEQARALLASGRAEVIQDLQGILSSTLTQGVVQLGGVPIDGQALHQALSLLACDAGARCGPDSPALLRECAYRGRCDAGSYYEYMFYYETSPSEAQMIDSYRRALSAMLQSGDLSGFTYAQGPGVPGFSMTFGGHRPYRSVDIGNAGGGDMPPAPKRFGPERA